MGIKPLIFAITGIPQRARRDLNPQSFVISVIEPRNRRGQVLTNRKDFIAEEIKKANGEEVDEPSKEKEKDAKIKVEE